MSMELTAQRGTVTVPVQQLREVRTECRRYHDNDPRKRCLEWNYELKAVTARSTGRVHVTASNGPSTYWTRGFGAPVK